jgi:Fe-Mn family superoxide dismutase
LWRWHVSFPALTFDKFDVFKQQFNDAGAKQFGSGWVWVVQDNDKLKIVTTPNQGQSSEQGFIPNYG